MEIVGRVSLNKKTLSKFKRSLLITNLLNIIYTNEFPMILKTHKKTCINVGNPWD